MRAVFVIQNRTLERKWKAYKTSLIRPRLEYYIKLQKNTTTALLFNAISLMVMKTLICCDPNSVCRITDSGFDKDKDKDKFPGPGFYLAP